MPTVGVLVPRPLLHLVNWPLLKIAGNKEADFSITAKAAIRIALFAVVTFSLLPKFKGSLAIAGVLGLFISKPVTALTVGFFLAKTGVANVLTALALGSFASLFSGLALIGGGYLTWQTYDTSILTDYPIEQGLLEYNFINPLTSNHAEK